MHPPSSHAVERTPRPPAIENGSTHAGWRWVALLLLTGGALAVKWHGAFDGPIWGDELFQRAGARDSGWLDFLTWSHAYSFNNMPPLSFALHKLFVVVPGLDGEMAWRLPGIIAATLCVPFIYSIARGIVGPSASLFAAALCAFDLNLAWNSQAARAYPFLVFFLVAALAVGSTDRPGRLAGAFLLFTAALWTNLFAFVFVGGCVAAGWAHWFFVPRRADTTRPSILLWSATAALVANVPFFLVYRFAANEQLVGIVSSGAADGWAKALSAIRWNVGLLTWIPLPLANPIAWLLILGALVVWGWQRASASAAMILGGGLAVIASQFYSVRHHDFLHPRYILGASVMLWIGAAILFEIGRRHIQKRSLLIGVAVLIVGSQAWRAWHNDRFYGTVSDHDRAGQHLLLALEFVRAECGNAQLEVVPNAFRLREGVERLDAPRRLAVPKGAPAAPSTVWLLPGQRSFDRRYGNVVAQFVESSLSATGVPAETRVAVQEQCENAFWTVWWHTPAGPAYRHF